MHPRAAELIRELELLPHPEGGFYRRVFHSSNTLANGRPCCTAIFFLLPAGVCGRWHRVDADELWHFYEGAPLELLIATTPAETRRERLGPVGPDCLPQRLVPAHAWQAARPLGDYSLVGCTVSPGFDFSGFRLLAEDEQAQREWAALDQAFL
ncbi:cupin domain-containing protein [Pseudomonas indica]|uniref:DUF985 domain-containing protein n=1 Tax=Pseudomonas indica TaxID=137658 RepID=A0A1G9MH64_9PSED|nr:cupin domain-containing protein [Pseudomonas indica]SDL73610.1 hypothetical protein SAMN05216186_12920 [Pseudomonas indica]